MIVKNLEELVSDYSGEERKARELAIKIAEYAIEKANPEKLVLDFLSVDENRIKLKTGESFYFSKVYVVAIGKAAYPMTKAVVSLIKDVEGIAVTKYGYSKSSKIGKVEVIEAGHPIPDENSVKAVEKALEILKKAKKDDLLILLISGGGSSLFAMPEKGISLKDKIKTYELLLSCGARIQEINTVRKHISAVKGGKFVKKAKCRVLALIISDVVGDDLETIASGISVKDPTTFEDAVKILKDYGIWDEVPESVRKYLERGLKDGEETLKEDLDNVTNKLICGSSKVCEFAFEKAEELGLKAVILTSLLEGESREVGVALASIAAEVKKNGRPVKPPVAMIAGGETTVTLSKDKAKGGPNQELALGFAKKLSYSNCSCVCLVSLDTDGTDGPTDAAGGIVSNDTWEKIKKAGMDPLKELMRHNSYEALKVAKSLVFTGPTETNVNSISVLVVL